MPPYEERERRSGNKRTARDEPREPSGRDGQKPVQTTRTGRGGLNEYWIDGEKINREVLQKQICKMLGPEAYSKPSVYNGIRGYWLTAVRPFTPDQLDDLIRFSEDYESEKRERRVTNQRDVPYTESNSTLRHDGLLSPAPSVDYPTDYTSDYPPDRYSTQQPTYSLPGPQVPYTTAASFAPQPAMAYPGSVYPPGPPSTQGYPGQGYPAVTRASEAAYYPQGEPAYYPSYAELPRDPRYAQPHPGRMDPRNDPRNAGRGYPNYSSPGAPMHYGDEDDYMTSAGNSGMSRGYPGTSRPPTNGGGYDPRDAPQIRDPYGRMDSPRERDDRARRR